MLILFGHPEISRDIRQFPGPPNGLLYLVSKGYTQFLALAPLTWKTPPHLKVSGPKSLSLCCLISYQVRQEGWRKKMPLSLDFARNRKPETLKPFFLNPKAEPEPSEPFSRNGNRNRPLLNFAETQKSPSPEEPPKPKTGTARTIPPPI